jgi:hypothetical protein
MTGIREWLKANGGAPAVVVVGIALVFAFWPLGVVVIVVGSAMWLYGWERFPLTVSRRRQVPDDRRELRGLAQAVSQELETCRYRLSKAMTDRRGWFVERQLPAETHNTRWTPSLATADEVHVNDALRGFYVWADEMNASMSDRASAEVIYVGSVVPADRKTLDLDDEDLAELGEGLSRIRNAQDVLAELISRLGPN